MATWSWSAETTSAPIERELFGASGLPSDAHPLLPFLIEHIVRLGADSKLEAELFELVVGLESREIETLFRQISKLPFRALKSDCSDTDIDSLKLKISKQEIIATKVPVYTPVTMEFEIKPTGKKSVLVRQWGQQGPLFDVFSFVSRYLLTLQGKPADLWNMVVFLQPNTRFRKIHLLEVGENPSIFYPILIDISEEHYRHDMTGRMKLSSSGGALRSSSGSSSSSSSSSSTPKKKKESKLGKPPGYDVKRVARAYAWAVAQTEFSTTSPIEELGDHAVVALYGTLVVCQSWPGIQKAGTRHWPASYWKTMDWLNDHRHEKLAPRIACSPEDNKSYIIYDAPYTIDELLGSLPASHREFSKFGKILIDVADALAYLHSQGKAHGRLSPWVVCHSTDLGTLLIDYANFDRTPPDFADFSISTPVQPTDAYLAPEIIGASEFTFPSDIFSFGILIWRLFNDKHPRSTIGEVKSGAIPPSSDTNDFETSGMASLFLACTNLDPSQRPSAIDCLERLKDLVYSKSPIAKVDAIPIVRRRLTSANDH